MKRWHLCNPKSAVWYRDDTVVALCRNSLLRQLLSTTRKQRQLLILENQPASATALLRHYRFRNHRADVRTLERRGRWRRRRVRERRMHEDVAKPAAASTSTVRAAGVPARRCCDALRRARSAIAARASRASERCDERRCDERTCTAGALLGRTISAFATTSTVGEERGARCHHGLAGKGDHSATSASHGTVAEPTGLAARP